MKIKRYLVAGAAAATLAGGAFAFAANLDVDSQNLASGSDSTDTACNVLAVEYTTDYSSLTYVLEDIELDGGATCANHSFKVTVDDGTTDGVEYDDVLDGTGKFTVDASADAIDAADVDNVTAVVTSAADAD